MYRILHKHKFNMIKSLSIGYLFHQSLWVGQLVSFTICGLVIGGLDS